jgi:ubiquitin carboxyl-terminal hydrolase 9/24
LKFDDFFQFPWTIDMGPYTTEGIQRAESDPITAAAAAVMEKDAESSSSGEPALAYRKVSFSSSFSRNNPDLHYPYELVGIVVHSGQANAGHYYSYIKVIHIIIY